MKIDATIHNDAHENEITVTTNGNGKSIFIPGKTEGRGSSVNGGELLFLALATCFCNDVYREAGKRKMNIDSVEVFVSGEFGNEGEPAANIKYQAHVRAANHSEEEIAELVAYVDTIAEVHNTLRKGVAVSFTK